MLHSVNLNLAYLTKMHLHNTIPFLESDSMMLFLFLLQNDNKRVIKKSGSNIYLLYYAKRTAVLVECGFVSNPQENKLLENSDYQRKMAFSIAFGIMEYINTKDV